MCSADCGATRCSCARDTPRPRYLEPAEIGTGERFRESQSAEGRYRLLVEGITDYAIYLLDSDGLVTSWNRGAQRFKGYSESEIIGQHFSRFYTEEDKAIDLPRTALRTAREEGRFEQEGWRVRKDGTRFWAHVVIDPIRDSRRQSRRLRKDHAGSLRTPPR